jgi:hypothetical protein
VTFLLIGPVYFEHVSTQSCTFTLQKTSLMICFFVRRRNISIDERWYEWHENKDNWAKDDNGKPLLCGNVTGAR